MFIGGPAGRIAQAVGPGSASSAFDRLSVPADLTARLEPAQRVGPVRYAHSLPPGHLRTAQGPGWALVGDAGHWMDPMTTHGMTAALRDAELLAESVVNGARAHQPSAGTYQDTRDRLSLPMLEVAEQIASFDWDLVPIRDLLRKMSSAITDEVETLADLGNAA